MNRQDSSYKTAAAAAFALICATIFSISSFAEDEKNQNPDASKARQEEDLGARIINLQGTKDCIKNAATREAVAACQKTIRLKNAEKKK